jgi:ABC-type glycerol-3-phosphate transport system substrate-binding protein
MKRAAMAAAILAGSMLLAGCGGDDDEAGAAAATPTTTTAAAADTAACEAAYTAQFEELIKTDPDELDKLDETNVPDACAGIDQPELEKIVRKVTDAAIKAAMEDAGDS